MPKHPIKNNQALTLYLFANLLLIAYLLTLFLFNVLSSESLTCQYRSFGSGATQECDIIAYFFDNIFWAVLPIIIAQIILIPTAIITYYASKYVQKNIKSKYKEQQWYKYLLALSLYVISIFIVIKIIDIF